MIQYLSHNQIDKVKWDQCIASACNSMVYAYSWYLDIVCPQWEALITADYKAVMPLTIRSKGNIKYLYPPFFTQQLGVFSSQLPNGICDDFLAGIPTNIKFIDIYLNEQNEVNEKAFKTEIRNTQFIDLSVGYDAIYQKYTANLKRYLRKCDGEYRLKISNEISAEQVVEMLEQTQSHKIKDLNFEDYKNLLQLIKLVTEKKLAQNMGVYCNQDNLCASATFITNSNRLLYFKCSSTENGRSFRAMHYLLDSIIKTYAGKDMILDFNGSNISSVAMFNKSFGAVDANYIHLKQNRLPWYIKWLKK
jgi:hypothetical protein